MLHTPPVIRIMGHLFTVDFGKSFAHERSKCGCKTSWYLLDPSIKLLIYDIESMYNNYAGLTLEEYVVKLGYGSFDDTI